MTHPRSERVAGLLRRELAQIVQREMEHDLPSLISVTDVEVSRDLSHAKVYVSSLDIEHGADIVRALNEAAPQIRHALAGRIRLRLVPTLKFLHDTSSESGQRIEQLLAASRRKPS
ncbi:MAG: 30S ribosome-binding factor RbfA [Pseudomonadota bacterium]